MRLACGDHTFSLLDHDVAVDLIAGMGFEGLDLAFMGGRSHVRPEQVRNDVDGWAGRVRTRLEAAGLLPSDLFTIPDPSFETGAPNHPDAATRERSRAAFGLVVEFGQALGMPGITTLPGIDWPEVSHEDSLKRAAEELSWRAVRALEAGMRFSIEPHFGSVVAAPEDTMQLLELSEGLELTLDYTHFVRQGYSESEVDPLLRHARHLHLRGARNGRLQVPMSQNTIDWERIVDLARELGYDGYLALEYVYTEWEDCNDSDTVSETVILRDRLRRKLAA